MSNVNSRSRDRKLKPRLGVLVCAFAVVFGVYLFNMRPKHNDGGIHLDIDESDGALTARIMATPASERDALILKSANDPNPGVRAAAIDQMREKRGPVVLAAIDRAFDDNTSIVRQRALEVAPTVDRSHAELLLIAGLQDDDLWIRQAAVRVLSNHAARHSVVADRNAIPALVGAVNDPDPTVGFMAMNLLRKLTGEPWHVTIRSTPDERNAAATHWTEWFAAHPAQVATEYRSVTRHVPTRSDPSPDFALSDVDGKEFSLTAQRGRLTLLNFWGTWCPLCIPETQDLNRVAADFRDKPVDVIGIAIGEQNNVGAFKQWLTAHGLTYRQAFGTPRIQEAFEDINEAPVTILIDAQGRIIRRWDGERDYRTFRGAIESALRQN